MLTAFFLAAGVGWLAERTRAIRVPDAATRIGCIDGLRGYLALSVMVHHFAVWLAFCKDDP